MVHYKLCSAPNLYETYKINMPLSNITNSVSVTDTSRHPYLVRKASILTTRIRVLRNSVYYLTGLNILPIFYLQSIINEKYLIFDFFLNPKLILE